MRIPTCEELDQFAYDFLEGQLDPQQTRAVEKHLKLCKNCQRFMASYRRIKKMTPDQEAPSLDPEFKKQLHQFLLQRNL